MKYESYVVPSRLIKKVENNSLTIEDMPIGALWYISEGAIVVDRFHRVWVNKNANRSGFSARTCVIRSARGYSLFLDDPNYKFSVTHSFDVTERTDLFYPILRVIPHGLMMDVRILWSKHF